MKNKTIQTQVFAAVETYPVGVHFTTSDILQKVRSRYATSANVSAYIARYPGIVNTTERTKLAVWRRSE